MADNGPPAGQLRLRYNAATVFSQADLRSPPLRELSNADEFAVLDFETADDEQILAYLADLCLSRETYQALLEPGGPIAREAFFPYGQSNAQTP